VVGEGVGVGFVTPPIGGGLGVGVTGGVAVEFVIVIVVDVSACN
jgi:hypothetical protein